MVGICLLKDAYFVSITNAVSGFAIFMSSALLEKVTILDKILGVKHVNDYTLNKNGVAFNFNFVAEWTF